MEQKLYMPKTNHYSPIGASLCQETLTRELIAENLYRMWLQQEEDMDPIEAMEKIRKEIIPNWTYSEAYSEEVEGYLISQRESLIPGEDLDDELEEITDPQEKEEIIDFLWSMTYREFKEQQHAEWD